MTYKTLGVFALAGAIAWICATLFYGAFGAPVIERAAWFYLANAGITGVILAVLFSGLTKATRIGRAGRLASALAFATPSFLFSIAFAPGLLRLFADTAPQSGGGYSFYVFIAYMLVVGLAISPCSAAQRA